MRRPFCASPSLPPFPLPCCHLPGKPRLSLTQPPLSQALVGASGPRKSVSPLGPHIGHELSPSHGEHGLSVCVSVSVCLYSPGSRVLSAGPHGLREPVRWVLSQVRIE